MQNSCRTVDCGVHSDTVNSQPNTRKQLDIIGALGHGTLSRWKQPWVHSWTDRRGQQKYKSRLWCLTDAHLVLTWLKSANKCPGQHYTTNSWTWAGWVHAFKLFTPSFDPTICCSKNRNSSDQVTLFQYFKGKILSNFLEPVWAVDSVSCSVLILHEFSPVWSSAAICFKAQHVKVFPNKVHCWVSL